MGSVRVHEDRVALLGGPVDGVGASGGDPEGRRGLLVRLGQDLDFVEVEVVAVPGDSVLPPGLDDDLDGLSEAGIGLFEFDAENAELGAVEAASGAPVNASAGEDVE